MVYVEPLARWGGYWENAVFSFLSIPTKSFPLTVSHCETLCLKKVPTFKLSVTLSNLNRFLKCLLYWRAYEICYKTHTTLPTSP